MISPSSGQHTRHYSPVMIAPFIDRFIETASRKNFEVQPWRRTTTGSQDHLPDGGPFAAPQGVLGPDPEPFWIDLVGATDRLTASMALACR
jgi:hypothetical protein